MTEPTACRHAPSPALATVSDAELKCPTPPDRPSRDPKRGNSPDSHMIKAPAR